MNRPLFTEVSGVTVEDYIRIEEFKGELTKSYLLNLFYVLQRYLEDVQSVVAERPTGSFFSDFTKHPHQIPMSKRLDVLAIKDSYIVDQLAEQVGLVPLNFSLYASALMHNVENGSLLKNPFVIFPIETLQMSSVGNYSKVLLKAVLDDNIPLAHITQAPSFKFTHLIIQKEFVSKLVKARSAEAKDHATPCDFWGYSCWLGKLKFSAEDLESSLVVTD